MEAALVGVAVLATTVALVPVCAKKKDGADDVAKGKKGKKANGKKAKGGKGKKDESKTDEEEEEVKSKEKDGEGKSKKEKDGEGKSKKGVDGKSKKDFGTANKDKAPINPHDPNYQTLANMDDNLLPKDQGAPGDGAKQDFKVDDRIKKGRHVQAANVNYMTLAGIGDNDALLPKDAGGVDGGGGGAPKNAAANPHDPNYQTLAGLGDNDNLLPKDAPGGGGGGGENFKVDDRIKKGRHMPATNENYMTLAGLGDNDDLLPKD